MRDRFWLSTGRGLLGTGVFLLGRRPAGAEVWDARSWACLLFLPLVPLRAARFHGATSATIGEWWEVECAPLETQRGCVGTTYAVAAGVLFLALAPVAFAWWTIHQTGLLQALKVVIGAAAPVLVLMWLDTRTPRVGR